MLNIHATALVVGDRGLVILGPSGSGKTTLAAALVARFSQDGIFSRLVGDDQLFAEARDGRLVLRVPATIAGLAEVPGLGPRPIGFEPAAVIDMAIRLVPPNEVPRFQEEAVETVAGCRLPLVVLAERDVVAALFAVPAVLVALPFRRD
jgi:serine kinase of HPr protein (carbohydrate metabolism regulator)